MLYEVITFTKFDASVDIAVKLGVDPRKANQMVRGVRITSYNVCYTKLLRYRLNNNEYVVKESTMSKLKSTKMADEVIYQCLQFMGGYGYMENYPMARLLRDSRLGPIGGGTSEILREILARIIIDKKEYKPVT